MTNDIDALRRKNIDIFLTMLRHLGRKEFDLCAGYLAPDMVSDWPYIPAPGCPERLTTRADLLEFIRAGTSEFDPFDYQISQIHELVDPNKLIVEYYSQTRYRPRDRFYSNKYLGVFHFKNGLITYWREYVNPEVIRQAMIVD